MANLNLGSREWGVGSGKTAIGHSGLQATPHSLLPTPHTLSLKRGFGLLEVLAAAVVLAFLLVGLSLLQKGNRESILRIRARDAANVVAQDIIDSISALGSASVPDNSWSCEGANETSEEPSLCRERIFTGSTSRKMADTMGVKVLYSALVEVKAADELQVVDEKTDFMIAGGGSGLDVGHRLSKQVDVTVNWKFKNSDQSINVSAVVR